MNILLRKMKFLLLVFIGIIFLQGCAKEDNKQETMVGVQSETDKRSTKNLDHPVSSNDVYEFRDSAHFIQYLRDLQDVIDSDYDRFRNEVSQDFQKFGIT